MNIYGKVLLLTYIFHFHMCKHLLVEPLGHKAEACLTAIIHLCSKCFASQTSELQACSEGLNCRVRAVCLTALSKHAGSVVVALGLNCSEAYGIFPDQGLNLCLLHCQADSLPLNHQEVPVTRLLMLSMLYPI